MPFKPEPIIWETIEKYFTLLQNHSVAAEMYQLILTDDFRTGFAGGHTWQGKKGIAEFLEARSVFFDESHSVEQLAPPEPLPGGRWGTRTRLSFFLRLREDSAAWSQEFTGKAFHWWELDPAENPRDWRVAAQVVEGFAELNPNAYRLFADPENGLNFAT
ncbi:hypothetical protein [Streptomyces vinaceus]|uniref:hypothetical protein n=1 Tax=Streptomyces vinaceus TaxID=1960 RepID=UPI00380C451B